jgi:6-phosphogluconolactonase
MNFKNILKTTLLSLMSMTFSCRPAATPDPLIPLYIGTYTGGGSEGIYLSMFDTITGLLHKPVVVAKLNNPSYITLSPDKTLLFAVGENQGLTPNLYSFKINSESHLLSVADSVTTGGVSSCYVSIVAPNMAAFANYSSGDVSFVSFDEDGKFSGRPITFQHEGSGPNTNRQASPHAHSIIADRDFKYVYAADLGADKLVVYQCGADTVVKITEVPITPGAGPRHLDFHPSGKMMALLNELTHTVEVFVPDERGIFSIKTDSSALLPIWLHEENYSADIHFSADGKNLYVSIRGVNHLEIFDVNLENNKIETIGFVSKGVNWPRNFTLDPTGNFLLIANEKGGDVIVYRRNIETGMLEPTDSRIEINSPVCLKF